MSGSDWTNQRKVALLRMRRYAGWKRHLVSQFKLRLLNTVRRRLGKPYTLLQLPKGKP